MENLTIIKIIVSHRQTADLLMLGNEFLLLYNDKKIVNHLILCLIRISCGNSLPWVKELLVDGNLCSDAMANPLIFRHAISLTIKKFTTGYDIKNAYLNFYRFSFWELLLQYCTEPFMSSLRSPNDASL